MDSVEEVIRAIVQDELQNLAPRTGPAVQIVAESPNRLYSVAAVAKLFEVSTDWVYDRINSGALAVVELGDGKAKQRISVTELQRFIDSRTYPSSARGSLSAASRSSRAS